MTETKNAPQEVVDDLMTDPDSDAEHAPQPQPPQTIANEPDGTANHRSNA